jgi:hypothetical protein
MVIFTFELTRTQSLNHFRGSMFKKLKEMYREYKAYVRVDLVMYAVMILLIILYFIYTVAVD